MVSKKNIMIVGRHAPPIGGIQTCIEQFYKSNLKKEYNLIKFNTTKPTIFYGNKFMKTIYFIYLCIKFTFFTVFKKIDIIHFHTCSKWGFWQPAFYLRIAKVFKKKTIFHMHGGGFPEFYNNLNEKQQNSVKKTLKSVDKIIVLSEKWKKIYEKIVINNKICVIHNSVDELKYRKYKLSKEKNKLKILYLGKISEDKGIYDLLNAINKLKIQNIEFIFVGPIENKKKFFETINRLKIRNKCKIIGEIIGDSRFKYFALASIFILPSHIEALPIALLEAMSFGLPIISTKVGAIPEVITNQKNGILIEPKNINELAKSIKKLVLNPKLREKMKLNNLQLIQSKYSINKFSQEIRTIYEKL